MPLMTTTIPCKGGLNLAATDEELLTVPNEAIQLVNMESSKNGGYRRISGFTEYGSSLPGGTGKIKGIRTYRGGVLVARDDTLYHSFDGTVWTPVNTDAAAGSDNDTVTAANLVPLSTANEQTLQMDVIEEGTKVHVYISTGNSNPLYLLITGVSDATAAYTFREVPTNQDDSEDDAILGSKWLAVFQDQVILANSTEDPTSLYYSSFATSDLTGAQITAGIQPQEIYTGATSGQLSVRRPITGIAEHRDVLYVFTDRSISRVVGLREGNPLVKPITNNIGCIDGNTIQEIGGDLIFLASDGLRTIAQTERIGDIELGVLSRKIAPITKALLDRRDRMTFSSCVIREKNQYRLWYSDSGVQQISEQKAIVAAFAFDSSTGGLRWEYSELLGWEATAVFAGEDADGLEFFIHGNSAGEVHEFEFGSTFNDTQIPWLYQTTFTHLGDIGIRKNIHDVFVKMKTEGVVNANMTVKYDYNSEESPQPPSYTLGELSETFTYGSGVYDIATYGITSKDDQKIFTEGSGFTVSLILSDAGQIDDPFTFESLQLNFTPSGRI